MPPGPASATALPILGIHGVPRSGTTWLGQIFNASPHTAFRFQPFFAYAFHARADAARTTEDLDAILGEIAATEDDYILQRGAATLARQELRFPKGEITQVVYKEVRFHHLLPLLMRIPRFRGVGIVRNPLDVLASWVRAPREFRTEWNLADEWRLAPSKNQGRVEEFYGYERWKAAALLFEQLQADAPDRFKVASYRDLVRDPLSETAALFAFAGLPMDAQVEAFLARSTSSDDDDPYGVLRGAGGRGDVGDLPDDIRAAVLADLSGGALEKYL
jgi:Sulfotransferase family